MMIITTSLSITNLRCEYLTNPQGVDISSPRLSWQLESKHRGQKQSSYQILVASSLDTLNLNTGDLWDSGKISSDATTHIHYKGKELQSTRLVFWKLRIWDQDDKASPWSTNATWTMGLLHDKDWGGKWIGLDGQIINQYLHGAHWIAFPDDCSYPVTQKGQRFYRRKVSYPFIGEIKRIRFLYTGDSECNAYINGFNLGARDDHHRIKDQDFTFRMIPGENVLAITGFIPGKTVNSGAVVALLEVIFEDGKKLLIPTDDQWKVSNTESPDWNKPGFDDSDWLQAQCLGPVGSEPLGEVRIAEDRRLPARYLRKEFNVKNPVKRATVFYSGLGWSELYINGSKIGDHVLSPGLTEYEKRLFYITADVTEQLNENQNAIGVLLGNGRFYSPRSSVYAAMPTYGFPKLRLHLRIEYENTTVDEIISDETWKLTDNGPIIANNEFDGEEYDARKELGNWTNINYDDSAWKNAQAAVVPSGRLQAQMIEPIRVTSRLNPATLTEPKPGVHIFDLGQNISGWCRLKVNGSAGTTVSLRHSETLLPDGTLSLANMRGAEVTDKYTLKGEGTEIWEPRFVFHGFRYVELQGYPGKPDIHTIEGQMINDDIALAGTFNSSDALLNSIYKNIIWGIQGNNKSIPLDCPQRDERQGWLGDRIEVMRGETYLFDNAAFYSKWLQDIRDAQQENGAIADIAPRFWPCFGGDDVSWPSASIIITNAMYEQNADKDIVRNNYKSIKRWMDHICEYLKDGIIECDIWGDWCVPPQDMSLIHTLNPDQKTAKAVLATTFLYHDARLMEQFAHLLGHAEDAAYFTNLADTIKNAFNNKYYNSECAQYDNGSQTSYILPLAYGMVPENQQTRVFNNLVQNIEEKSNSHIGCGMVGIKYLYRVLSDNGRADLAYTIATQPDYPGYGYMVSNGATTIWELWNGNKADPWMNSGNHVMLTGDLVIWLYGYLAGILPDTAQPGFKSIIMKPHLVKELEFVNASFHSIRGLIKSEWTNKKDQFEWNILIPPNTSAVVFIPAVNGSTVYESGVPASKAEGVTYDKLENGYAIYNITSGAYRFTTLTK